MKLHTLLKATVFTLTIGSFSVIADTVDLFSDSQPVIFAAGASTMAPFLPTASSTALGGDIIGGERDIYLSAGANVLLNAGVAAGELSIGSSIIGGGGGNDYTVITQWDGVDGDATPGGFDTTGLGSQDLSELDGFLVSLLSSDGVGTFIVDMWDAFGEQASIGFSFIPVALGSPEEFFIDFGLFTGATPLAGFPVEFPVLGGVNPAFNFAAVSAIQLIINGTGNLDLRVDSITSVPAPGSIALMGLALLGLAGLSRRRA